MDERLRQTLLYDFYGELLTEHQRQVYSAVVFDDMSYAEVASEFDISRQAGYDLVKRSTAKLEELESGLHLVARFEDMRESMNSLLGEIKTLKTEVNRSVSDSSLKESFDNKFDEILDKSKKVFDEF